MISTNQAWINLCQIQPGRNISNTLKYNLNAFRGTAVPFSLTEIVEKQGKNKECSMPKMDIIIRKEFN